VLVGLDELTALVRDAAGGWRVDGPGTATVYRKGAEPTVVRIGEFVDVAPAASSR
jgi:hypothetical protein